MLDKLNNYWNAFRRSVLSLVVKDVKVETDKVEAKVKANVKKAATKRTSTRKKKDA